ncbi:hypothetical protein ACRDNQ_03930 [Palleronia sp. KMU-117]|uniref:hypothetical protein n=1 Tax=Palleronia sp. KMU-117 TaxID=3434108 RepID=UPI003D727AF3
MRTIHQLQDIQRAIYQFRVAQGRYLKDIPYESLCDEARADIIKDARIILFRTNLRIRLVRRNGQRVWRFVDRETP